MQVEQEGSEKPNRVLDVGAWGVLSPVRFRSKIRHERQSVEDLQQE